jgi:hypothetical protein
MSIRKYPFENKEYSTIGPIFLSIGALAAIYILVIDIYTYIYIKTRNANVGGSTNV